MSLGATVPTGRRTQRDVAAERAQDAATVRSYWSNREEHVLQDKEEHIRGAINTVALQGVLHSPMALEETERQRVMRRQREAIANHQRAVAALRQGAQGEAAQQGLGHSGLPHRSDSAGRLSPSPVGSSKAQPPHFSKVARPVSASIARPTSDRIPSALFAPQNTLLGSGRGGGGRVSHAAVSQLSPRIAQLAAQQHEGSAPSPRRSTRCNGVSRPSSALDNPDVPMFSSFSHDGIFRSHCRDGGGSVGSGAASTMRTHLFSEKQRRATGQRAAAHQARNASLGALVLLEQRFVDGSAAARRMFYAAACSPSPTVAAACWTPDSHTTGGGRSATAAATHLATPSPSDERPSTGPMPASKVVSPLSLQRVATSRCSAAAPIATRPNTACTYVPYAPTPPPCSLHRHSVDPASHVGVYVQGDHRAPHPLPFRSPVGGGASEGGLQRRRSSVMFGAALHNGRRSSAATRDGDPTMMDTDPTMPSAAGEEVGVATVIDEGEDGAELLGATKSTTASVVFTRSMGCFATSTSSSAISEACDEEGDEAVAEVPQQCIVDGDARLRGADVRLVGHPDEGSNADDGSAAVVPSVAAVKKSPAPPPLRQDRRDPMQQPLASSKPAANTSRGQQSTIDATTTSGGMQRVVSSLAGAFQVAFPADYVGPTALAVGR